MCPYSILSFRSFDQFFDIMPFNIFIFKRWNEILCPCCIAPHLQNRTNDPPKGIQRTRKVKSTFPPLKTRYEVQMGDQPSTTSINNAPLESWGHHSLTSSIILHPHRCKDLPTSAAWTKNSAQYSAARAKFCAEFAIGKSLPFVDSHYPLRLWNFPGSSGLPPTCYGPPKLERLSSMAQSKTVRPSSCENSQLRLQWRAKLYVYSNHCNALLSLMPPPTWRCPGHAQYASLAASSFAGLLQAWSHGSLRLNSVCRGQRNTKLASSKQNTLWYLFGACVSSPG